MKTCTNCQKNPATVHFQSLVNGHSTEWDLCPGCAQQKGIPFFTSEGFSLSPSPMQTLTEMIAQLADETAAEEKKLRQARCSHCGLAYAEFNLGGRLGCAHCFTAFGPYLEPLLKNVHGYTQHAGKKYAARRGTSDAPAGGGPIRTQEIHALEKELKESVKREEFEKAAQLRDRLRRLKEKS